MKKLTAKKINKKVEIDPLGSDLSAMIARSEMIPASTLFDYLPKDSSISLRLPTKLLESVRKITRNKNIQNFIREAVIEKIKKEAS